MKTLKLLAVALVLLAAASPVAARAEVKRLAVVPGLSSQVHSVICFAGSKNLALVVDSGSARLDLEVYDGSGKLIVAVRGFTGHRYATWHTYRSGTFYIKVVNPSLNAQAYVLNVK